MGAAIGFKKIRSRAPVGGVETLTQEQAAAPATYSAPTTSVAGISGSAVSL